MSARDFVLQQLRANPNLTYVEVRDRASAAGLTVAPFLYGSMRRQLGLPPKAEPVVTGGATGGAAGGKPRRDDELSEVDLAAAEDQIAGDADDQADQDGDDPSADADAAEPAESAGGPPVTGPLTTGPLTTASLTTSSLTMAMAGQTRARASSGLGDAGATADSTRVARKDSLADSLADAPADAPGGAADDPPGNEAGKQQAKGSGFKFAVDALRLSPDLQYQDLKARAKLAGLSLPPIVYGRAKALLGLVPTKPRRSKSDAPRVLRQVDSAIDLSAPFKPSALPASASAGLRQLEQMIHTVRELEAENRHLRNALQAALTITSAALEEIEE